MNLEMEWQVRRVATCGAILLLALTFGCESRKGTETPPANNVASANNANSVNSASTNQTPSTMRVNLGDGEIVVNPAHPGPVTIEVTNQGKKPHDFSMEGNNGVKTSMGTPLNPGETRDLLVPNFPAGQYRIFCKLHKNHDSQHPAIVDVK